MEYLKESRGYFEKFRNSRSREYFDIMREFNVGPGTGYPRFYKCEEVIQCIHDINGFLDTIFLDTSIPDKFSSPMALVDSWRSVKDYLEKKGIVFEEIFNRLSRDYTNTHPLSEPNSIYELAPEPLLQINRARLELLDLINFILNMDDVKEYTNLKGNSIDRVDSIIKLLFLCNNFNKFCIPLGREYHGHVTTIDNEYAVQYYFRSLLMLHFDDVRPEECTPSYAGKSSRIDFLISDEEIAFEIKMARHDLKDKEIANELFEDIKRYAKHPKCKKLICFVYDPKHLMVNPWGLEKDLSEPHNGLEVLVIVNPKP